MTNVYLINYNIKLMGGDEMRHNHPSRPLAFLVSLCLLFTLTACGTSPDPSVPLLALVNSEVGKTSGRTYFLSAEEGEASYISDVALTSIYGFDRTLNGISDGAIYLSDFCHPCEFAVFVCRSTYAAEDVAIFLKARLRTLYESASQSAAFCGMDENEYRAYIKEAEVLISGKYVALIISSDTKEAKRSFYRST
jgi:hypothetical protein